jgi:hypothetical protein
MPSPVGIFKDAIGRFRFLELLGQANNPVEFINSGVLFVNREFRVADDVEEENVGDLKLNLLLNLSGQLIHLGTCATEETLNKALSRRDQTLSSPVAVPPLDPPNQLSGRFGPRALREACQEFMGNCQRLLIIVQHLGKQTGLIKQAIFVHRVLGLRDLILLERFLRLASESKAVTEIGSHIRIIESASNRFLVMLDRVGPVLPIVIPIGQGRCRIGRRQS